MNMKLILHLRPIKGYFSPNSTCGPNSTCSIRPESGWRRVTTVVSCSGILFPSVQHKNRHTDSQIQIQRNVIEKRRQCNVKLTDGCPNGHRLKKVDSDPTNGPIWSQLSPVNFSDTVLSQNIYRGSYTSGHFIWNLWNEPSASFINFIWNDHECKILFIIWQF